LRAMQCIGFSLVVALKSRHSAACAPIAVAVQVALFHGLRA
jgi:hypothetical protein